jgi:hypothetical protein
MGAFEMILYVVFSLLASVGLFLIGNHFHSRRLGLALAAGSLLFFFALAYGLLWLVRTYGG